MAFADSAYQPKCLPWRVSGCKRTDLTARPRHDVVNTQMSETGHSLISATIGDEQAPKYPQLQSEDVPDPAPWLDKLLTCANVSSLVISTSVRPQLRAKTCKWGGGWGSFTQKMSTAEAGRALQIALLFADGKHQETGSVFNDYIRTVVAVILRNILDNNPAFQSLIMKSW